MNFTYYPAILAVIRWGGRSAPPHKVRFVKKAIRDRVKDHTSMNSLEDLRNMDGDGYFYDKVNGIVFVNLKGTYSRSLGDVNPCGKNEEACISKVIIAELSQLPAKLD